MTRTNRSEIKKRIPRVTTAQPGFRLVGHGLSDVGCRREVNEDSYLILPKNHLWIVADGMGGHAGGQYASTLTVESIARSILKRLAEAEAAARESQTPFQMTELIDVTIRETCAAVYDRAIVMPELRGMGSTVTAMLAYGEMAWIGHVGDSRAYLIRDGQIHQITEDHSLVQEQVAAGLITAEQAKHSMIRNIITRSIGFERDVRVDTAAIPMKRGDQFILCSDGLTGHVEDHEILEIVSETPRANAPARLIELANQRGGEDNSTVVLAAVLSTRNTTRGNRRRVRGS